MPAGHQHVARHGRIERSAANPRRRAGARVTGVVALVLVCAFLIPAIGVAAPGGAQEDDRVARAIEHIQAQRLDDALRELDAAIEADGEDWEAYYQRGRVHGLQGDFENALVDLLRAADLNAGSPPIHELASVAAWAAGDRRTAWDQAILAHLAGGDVTARIQRMAESGVPGDFQERVTAPRVYVAEVALEELEARAEIPFDRNAMAREDQSRSGVPLEVLGADLATESMADLNRVRTRFRAALADSSLFGIVGENLQAEYDLRIAADELSERPPRAMKGYLELVARDSGTVGYRRTLQFDDISAGGPLRGDVELVVAELEAWLRELRRSTESRSR